MKLPKMATFVTKQRLAIITGSLSTALVLVILSMFLGVGSLVGSLFVNLAASAITAGVTVALIDYLLSKERSMLSREGRDMAQLEARSIQMIIGTAVNNLFRRYSPKHGDEIPKSVEDDYIKYLFSHLDEAEFKDAKFKFHTRDIVFFESEITTAIKAVEKIIAMYGYALSMENRSNLHHLYTQLRAIDSVLSSRNYALRGVKKQSKSDMQEFTKKFDELLKMLVEELYSVSKDKFTISI